MVHIWMAARASTGRTHRRIWGWIHLLALLLVTQSASCSGPAVPRGELGPFPPPRDHSDPPYEPTCHVTEELVPDPPAPNARYLPVQYTGLDGPVAHQEGALGSDPTPQDVHIGIVDDPSRTMAITWRTDDATTAGRVWLWDPQGKEYVFDAASLAYSVKRKRDRVRVHEVVLENLIPGSMYTYRVGTEGALSPAYTFSTAREALDTFSFGVIGDSRTGWTVFAKQLETMVSQGVAFVLHTGDLVTHKNSQRQWDAFFAVGEEVFPHIPIMPVMGNHEEMARSFFARFSLPSDETNYHFVYGNMLFIALFDTIRNDADVVEEGLSYLEWALATHPEVTWRLVFHHHPIYSSGSHGGRRDLKKRWTPIYDLYHVDLVFSGHEHNYERTHPILDGRKQEIDEEGRTGGTIYVVTGGGGAGLFRVRKAWFTKKSAKIHHHCIVSVEGNRLTVVVRDKKGKQIDTFTLTKPFGSIHSQTW